MIRIKDYFLSLSATDLLVVIFYVLLTVINLVFCNKIDSWNLLIVFNIAVILFVFWIANFEKINKSFLVHQIHGWYLIPLIFVTFKELYLVNGPIHGSDYDNILIAIDRYIFGTDPTHVLYKISHPALTELLQFSYHLFYFFPILLGVELIRDKKTDKFHFLIYSLVYGFFLSYIGYLLVPAIGPRFTLHDFNLINTELPGLWITNFLRDWVNAGESIYPWTINPIEVVQRDVFPSGHTQMTLIIMFLSLKFRTKSRPFNLVFGSLLIFSTVYLRYHYVIDVFAGIVLMIFTMWSGFKIYNWWKNIKNEKLFRY
ncbi:MAG: phosphatase PAP2 family protein [Melioribacteraceae bacterium]|nr:phosphatase PAP2 family protein [Melioribacteraceae bacterium]